LTEHFVYDSQSRLLFTISAEGRVIENRYDSSVYGLLTNTIAYTANRIAEPRSECRICRTGSPH